MRMVRRMNVQIVSDNKGVKGLTVRLNHSPSNILHLISNGFDLAIEHNSGSHVYPFYFSKCFSQNIS